ncbi:MAG: hypothetical protein LBI84_01710 [Propionibacteriaceae bacterium]|jgi:prolyl-tRNA editing enzyme YbaK/EbsC (Cys-tRNA(Pro) deacylase)|nr:hypothetical protein [Propionibacteriaceae bacterium]
MWFDALAASLARDNLDLLAPPVAAAIAVIPEALVFSIDPADADTATLAAKLALPLEASANAVLVSGRRSGQERQACCLTLAHRRVDVNGEVRRRLDVRKASFMPAATATTLSKMAYGGITPIGLPADWPIWLDSQVTATDWVCVGAGNRSAKLIVPGPALLRLPQAIMVEGLAYTPGPTAQDDGSEG